MKTTVGCLEDSTANFHPHRMSSCLRNPQSLAGKKTGASAGCLAGEEAGCEGAEQGKWTEHQGVLKSEFYRVW